ncbi:hypothetical protein GCM10010116_39810 [Microbispora rosea subsp. aerata]|nr:hypothetical protein GCM10010116_39810 [Microbispora rosea subsp. aerata]GIH57026.1 hypothetical protein Mro02_39400 [Microbispora rosea subsp. aerata]GLJ83483.1 hypothetical protein GCM10017588_22110 [Microbispora rosea subsp. aerata]
MRGIPRHLGAAVKHSAAFPGARSGGRGAVDAHRTCAIAAETAVDRARRVRDVAGVRAVVSMALRGCVRDVVAVYGGSATGADGVRGAAV